MAFIANMDDPIVRIVYFVELRLVSGTLYINSSDKDITVSSNKYLGIGSLGEIGEYSTSIGTVATSLKLSLLNVPPAFLVSVLAENTRNRRVIASIGLFDEANNLKSAPIIYFSGAIDSMNVTYSQVSTVTLSASSKLLNWNKSTNSRYTNEDQQSKYPADKGFKFISSLSTMKLKWGD